MDEQLLDTVAGVCRRVQRLVACYAEGREPDKLNCLVFHVDRLHCMLLALNVSNEVLEAVGMNLTMLEELDQAQSTEYECGYTPFILHGNCRGRPRLEVTPEQLVYLLHLGFKCPKIAELLLV